MSGLSFLIHIALVAFFSFNPWPAIIKVQPAAYTVTLMPLPIQEPQIKKTEIEKPQIKKTEIKKPSAPPVVKKDIPKPIEKHQKDDIVEKVKEPQKEKVDPKHLQEAIEEIRRKVALDDIQKRVARREKSEERKAVVSPSAPIISSPKTIVNIESKLNEYYSMIWTKIKEGWTIPENLIREKEMVDIETIIVLTIERNGKIQKWWFEKKSGNDLYDQMAARAIKKAEPFPPIPKEFSENTLEIGIRFSLD